MEVEKRMKPGDRIELHPATDHWMRGDRYGTIVYIAKTGSIYVLLDKSRRRIRLHPDNVGRLVSEART